MTQDEQKDTAAMTENTASTPAAAEKSPVAQKLNETLSLDATATPEKPYEEFEIGEHKVPWFLWVFFTFIVIWASLSWIKFFGY